MPEGLWIIQMYACKLISFNSVTYIYIKYPIIMEMMRAIMAKKYGPPEVLEIMETQKPVPKDHEVLIRIAAISVTASDCIVRGFKLPGLSRIPARLALGITKPRKPVLGMVFSGVVERVGKNVVRFLPGDPVFAHSFLRFGAYAEYIRLPESAAIALMPSNTSFEEAAAIPFGGTLALFFMKKAHIQRGQHVLIYGASGAVGTSAIQLAKWYGAEVTGVCSTANLSLIRSLGADKVIDYTKEDMTKLGLHYDVIFDAVGKHKRSGLPYRNALSANGKFLSVDDGSPGERAINKDTLNTLKALMEKGLLKPVIDRIYPFEEMVEAHRFVDLGHKKGNVIISLK